MYNFHLQSCVSPFHFENRLCVREDFCCSQPVLSAAVIFLIEIETTDYGEVIIFFRTILISFSMKILMKRLLSTFRNFFRLLSQNRRMNGQVRHLGFLPRFFDIKSATFFYPFFLEIFFQKKN